MHDAGFLRGVRSLEKKLCRLFFFTTGKHQDVSVLQIQKDKKNLVKTLGKDLNLGAYPGRL